MTNWKKKFGLGLLGLGLLLATPEDVQADCCYDQCCDSCFGGFEIGADFLYWKPCNDTLDYAVVRTGPHTSGTSPIETVNKWSYKCLCTDWEPGFRIRFGKDDIWCNWRLDASYTWLDINSSESCKAPTDGGDEVYVSSPFFHPSFAEIVSEFEGNLTFVKGSYSTTYQTWDVLLGYDIACNRCHSIRPFFGVEGLILNQSIKVVGLNDVDVENVDKFYTNWSSDFTGAGLKVGSNYEFQMFDCLKFYGTAAAVVTVGNHDGSYKSGLIDTSGNIYDWEFKDGDCCQFVPGYHLAAGLLYETDACGCEFAIRLGWEFVQWWNVTKPRVFSYSYYSDSPNTTSYGLHGLVAGIDFSF